MTAAASIAELVAHLDGDPRTAGELRYTRKQLASARNERQRDRIWRAFVVAMTGRFASTLARDDPARLDVYREIFAELDRPAQPELCL